MNFEKNKDKLIVLLLILVAGLLIYTIVLQKNSSTISDRDNLRLRSQLADNKRSGGSDVDPYEKNEVKNTIIKNAADPIQVCYKEWVKSHPQFSAGRVVLDWQIRPDGSVDNPEIVNSEIPDINSCIIDNIKKLKFPPPPNDKPYYIVHKFFFKREEPSGESK